MPTPQSLAQYLLVRSGGGGGGRHGTVRRSPLAVRRSLPTARRPPLAAHRSPPTAHRSPLTASRRPSSCVTTSSASFSSCRQAPTSTTRWPAFVTTGAFQRATSARTVSRVGCGGTRARRAAHRSGRGTPPPTDPAQPPAPTPPQCSASPCRFASRAAPSSGARSIKRGLLPRLQSLRFCNNRKAKSSLKDHASETRGWLEWPWRGAGTRHSEAVLETTAAAAAAAGCGAGGRAGRGQANARGRPAGRAGAGAKVMNAVVSLLQNGQNGLTCQSGVSVACGRGAGGGGERHGG